MKKHIEAVCVLLVAVMLFSFVSCTGKEEKNTEAKTAEFVISKITESAEAQREDYVSAFKKYLTDYLEKTDNISNNRPCFSLHYLDGDDVPELFVSQGADRVSRVIIISFDGTEIKELGTLGYFGVIGFEEKTGTVVKTNTSQSQINSTVYKLENGKLEEYWRGDHFLGGNPDGDAEEYYSSNGKTVNKTEFDRDFNANMPETVLTNRYSVESRAFPSVRFEVDGEEHEVNAENIESYIK